MVFEDPKDRPASKEPCIWWKDTFCSANDKFAVDDISCFNDGNCDGFGTCRGCSKYDQGGLKLDNVDGVGGKTQTPVNLKVLNIRARIQPCCHWQGAPVDFEKSSILNKGVPVFVPKSKTPDLEAGEQQTKCDVIEAAPWQEGFTEENPSAYGCNGAKAECPFYTGPKFTEVVDEKMDTGNRVTGKQIMELRFYSANWKGLPNPRAVWESRFSQPDIWAWARDLSSTKEFPGSGKTDDFGNPMIQKVSISDFNSDSPIFQIGPPQKVSAGTPVLGGPPDYPTLVKELFLISGGLKVLWPANTSSTDPFIRKTFAADQRLFYISAQVNSDSEVYAVNLTKHPQNEKSDLEFVKFIKNNYPEDLIKPVSTGLPGATFIVKLESSGQVSKVNKIRLFLDLEDGTGQFLTEDVYIQHVFYHAHVAQTKFGDLYGHRMVDPWINHFTRLEIEGNILNLTNNTSLKEVFWNSYSSSGLKSLYAIEEQKTATSADPTKLSWEPAGCGCIAVTFKDLSINGVSPWKSWDTDSKGAELYVRVNRQNNQSLANDEPRLVNLTLSFASTAGSVIPANVAIFCPEEPVRSFDPLVDILEVRYAYTVYKQGPIKKEDEAKLKFPEDLTKVIKSYPYEATFNNSSFEIDGTFLRVGGTKLYSCDEVIGDCYTQVADENEIRAREVFVAGGVGEDSIKTSFQMIDGCAARFNSSYSSLFFEDGTPVSFNEAVNRMENKHLNEGSQVYVFIFQDEEGRPIGVKDVTFLTQSAMVQARDVEIRYKWGAHMQHIRPNHQMQLLLSSVTPPIVTTARLVYLIQTYDPVCGDHAVTEGASGFRAFDLAVDEHGALWYPYKQCFTPQYHTDSEIFTNSIDYAGPVEGFDNGKRRDYWERMRAWDKFMPIIMDEILLVGCNWNYTETNLNANPPFPFLGYTKIRSLHLMGPYSTDRESIRLSRHAEKKNAFVSEETITQEEDGLTLTVSENLTELLYDENGNLKADASAHTPVWMHMQDDLSVVSPASESQPDPFANLLLVRVGTHQFEEQFISSQKFGLDEVFEERDYTITTDREEDGSKIYLSDGTTLNTPDGVPQISDGSDIKWAFKDSPLGGGGIGWSWLAEPNEPIRGAPKISALFITNPTTILFKKNFKPATFTTEGQHKLKYEPHEFNDSGAIIKSASISMDGGPPLLISQDDGQIFILSSSKSPYDPLEHLGEDYEFVLYGKGPDGIGILADARGLQRFEVDGKKFATLAGISVNLTFDINELPYEIVEFRNIPRLADFQLNVDGEELTQEEYLDSFIREYEASELGIVEIILNFLGHYYVEKIDLEFTYGDDTDVPAVRVSAIKKGTIEEVDLFEPTSFLSGAGVPAGKIFSKTFIIEQRLHNLVLSFGARSQARKMVINRIDITMRNHILREETITTFEPKVDISVGNTGTHRPSRLEFYFQRAFPDFAKDYLSGSISLGDIGQESTAIAGVTLKYNSRLIKDIIPQFEFTDPLQNRFNYDSISFAEINGYTEGEGSLGGVIRYIDGAVQTCSKGWTLYTNEPSTDPGASLNHPNSFEFRAYEDGQEELYNEAAGLLGDKLTVYNSFWHPKEIEFFLDSGVNLSKYSWSLTMSSTVAPIERVFRHENYGCSPDITNEYSDGLIHRMENWQARGAWLYFCNTVFNFTCFQFVVNKCYAHLFDEYETPEYLNTDLIAKYSNELSFPPRSAAAEYVAQGLVDKNYMGGVWSGFNPTSASAASFSHLPFGAGGPIAQGPFFGLSVILGLTKRESTGLQ